METSQDTALNWADEESATVDEGYRSRRGWPTIEGLLILPTIMEISQEIAVNRADEESATVDEGYRPRRGCATIVKGIFNRSFLSKWKWAFLASCVFGVLIDPLFFYIPIVNKNTKCIGLDNSLKGAVISLRSTTDLFYVVNIVIQIHIVLTKGTILVEDALAMAKRIWRISSHIVIDILAVLPIPQVFGSFWYFLAIQREMACWQNACRNNNGCEPATFYCNVRTIRNITFLDDFSRAKPRDE
ncbi:hypothetical protein ACE6H2_027023 [Prunus campanulata]